MSYTGKPQVVGIDPSLASLGLGMLDEEGIALCAASFTQQRTQGWGFRAAWMATAVRDFILQANILASYCPVVLAVEVPIVFHLERGKKSMAKGDVQKLYATVGAIFHALTDTIHRLPEAKHWAIIGVNPQQWKGTAPKSITNKRTLSWLERTHSPIGTIVDHNALDALGIARKMHSALTYRGHELSSSTKVDQVLTSSSVAFHELNAKGRAAVRVAQY
jgi:hypothetical protein